MEEFITEALGTFIFFGLLFSLLMWMLVNPLMDFVLTILKIIRFIVYKIAGISLPPD